MNTNTKNLVAKSPVSSPSVASASLLSTETPLAGARDPVSRGRARRTRRRSRARGQARPLFDPAIVRRAIVDSFRKLDPRHQVRNPVMFVVEVGSVLTTGLFVQALVGTGRGARRVHPRDLALALVHRPLRELRRGDGRGARQGAGRLAAQGAQGHPRARSSPRRGATPRRSRVVGLAAPQGRPRARRGGRVRSRCDGEIVEGVASVDESAITGESAPVIRESGGDRSAVTGGTRVLSDWLVVRITANPGETFLDRMIAMVEGAKRQKTPNEIALDILLAALTIIFLLATVTLLPFSLYSVDGGQARARRSPSRCSSRCSCASSRRPSAACSRPSASPAWTG